MLPEITVRILSALHPFVGLEALFRYTVILVSDAAERHAIQGLMVRKIEWLERYLVYDMRDEQIRQFRSLRHLDLRWNRRVTDAGICGLPLVSLRLSGDSLITNRAIRALSLLVALDLMEDDCRITDAGICNLPLQSLRIMRTGLRITDLGIGSLTSLRHLSVTGCEHITDSCLSSLRLTGLTLITTPLITDVGIHSQCGSLRDLGIGHGSYITNEVLADCAQLVELCLMPEVRFHLKPLEHLPSLRTLRLVIEPDVAVLLGSNKNSFYQSIRNSCSIESILYEERLPDTTENYWNPVCTYPYANALYAPYAQPRSLPLFIRYAPMGACVIVYLLYVLFLY